MYVTTLSRRTAHATHALIVTCRELGMPATAAEIVIYDEEASSVRSTGSALAAAARRGLAAYTGRYWVPTKLAYDLRTELEDRYLNDTEGRG